MSKEIEVSETTNQKELGKKTSTSDEPAATPLTVSRNELLADGTDQMFRQLVHDIFAFTARHAAIRDGHARRIGLAGIDYTI